MNLLVSACLLGINCRYDGTGEAHNEVMELFHTFHFIPVCPEQLGGMATPREPSEIQTDGRVVTQTGRDVTRYFCQGARQCLSIAQLYHCRYAILKERSPSCGHGAIYDGSFTKKLKSGSGITARVLEESGILVFGESQIGQLKDLKNT